MWTPHQTPLSSFNGNWYQGDIKARNYIGHNAADDNAIAACGTRCQGVSLFWRTCPSCQLFGIKCRCLKRILELHTVCELKKDEGKYSRKYFFLCRFCFFKHSILIITLSLEQSRQSHIEGRKKEKVYLRRGRDKKATFLICALIINHL